MRLLTVLLIFTCSQVAGLSQTREMVVRNLALEDCLELALKHNLNLQIQRLDPQIARYSLSAAYGAYDPAFNISGEHTYSLSPGGIDPQGRTFVGNETESDAFRSGFSGLLPWGLNYSLGGSIADVYGTRPGFIPDLTQPEVFTNNFVDINTGQTVSFVGTNYATMPRRTPFGTASGTVGFLELRQPLLRDFLTDSTRLQIFLNRRNVQTSELELRMQVMTIVTIVEEAYYNLMFAQDNVRVQQAALELADRLLAENRKRVEVGALAPLDEMQAESQAAGRRADLLAAQGTEDTQQRVLKSLLSDDYSQWQDVIIKPTANLVAVPQRFDLQESWRNGLTKRPDLAQQKIAMERQGYIIRYQRNQVLPRVDLVGTYGYRAAGDEFAGAFEQLGRGDYPFWSYGAELRMPLMQTTARNTLRSAKATGEQIALQLKQMEQNILIRIENAIANAQTAFQRVAATREARIYAQSALEAEQKKLESGKSTSFEVLSLQRDLTAARSAEIRALADYNIALAQISLNEGTTLERRNVTFERGPN
jgi:outer membrane protein